VTTRNGRDQPRHTPRRSEVALSSSSAARTSRWAPFWGQVEQVPQRLNSADVALVLPKVLRRAEQPTFISHL
jgi:hypothetical protein